jgi:YHS domain-containing protein
MTHQIHRTATVLGVLALVALFSACSRAAEPKEAGDQAALERVELKRVCMVNDTAFERDQIPVKVNNTTYYGCCQMCEERLKTDQAVRLAVDPITGDWVDKASAVVAARRDQSVLYFSSEETLERYRKGERHDGGE